MRLNRWFPNILKILVELPYFEFYIELLLLREYMMEYGWFRLSVRIHKWYILDINIGESERRKRLLERKPHERDGLNKTIYQRVKETISNYLGI